MSSEHPSALATSESGSNTKQIKRKGVWERLFGQKRARTDGGTEIDHQIPSSQRPPIRPRVQATATAQGESQRPSAPDNKAAASLQQPAQTRSKIGAFLSAARAQPQPQHQSQSNIGNKRKMAADNKSNNGDVGTNAKKTKPSFDKVRTKEVKALLNAERSKEMRPLALGTLMMMASSLSNQGKCLELVRVMCRGCLDRESTMLIIWRTVQSKTH